MADISLHKNKKGPNEIFTREWWTDPVVWGFAVLAAAAYFISSIESAEWVSILVLYTTIAAGILIVIYITRKRVTEPVLLSNNARDVWPALAWYVVFVVVSLITRGGDVFGNEFMKYIWFAALPLLMVYFQRGRNAGLRDVMRSIGFRREGLGIALLSALLAYAAAFTGLIFFLPDAQMDKLNELLQTPMKLLLVLPLSFGFSLVTAAITEEVFFRGILQSRLATKLHSDVRGCLITSLLFGLYHLPYAYFSDSWPTHGNILWAASSVIAEQAVTGVILGFLFLRTRNLAAPVLFHALVNTVAVMTMFN